MAKYLDFNVTKDLETGGKIRICYDEVYDSATNSTTLTITALQAQVTNANCTHLYYPDGELWLTDQNGNPISLTNISGNEKDVLTFKSTSSIAEVNISSTDTWYDIVLSSNNSTFTTTTYGPIVHDHEGSEIVNISLGKRSDSSNPRFAFYTLNTSDPGYSWGTIDSQTITLTVGEPEPEEPEEPLVIPDHAYGKQEYLFNVAKLPKPPLIDKVDYPKLFIRYHETDGNGFFTLVAHNVTGTVENGVLSASGESFTYLSWIIAVDEAGDSVLSETYTKPTGCEWYECGEFEATELNLKNVFWCNSDLGQPEEFVTLETTLPELLCTPSASVVGEKVYLFGGTNVYAKKTIHVFDTKNKTIVTLNTTLPIETSELTSTAVGTKIYLFGGRRGGGLYNGKLQSLVTFDTINVFDTNDNTITTLDTRLPSPASHIASVAVGTKIYLFGGYYSDNAKVVYNTINVFDTENETITTLDVTLPYDTYGIAAVLVGTKIYLFGGASRPESTSNETVNLYTVSVFDIESEYIDTLDVTVPITYSIKTANIGTKVYLFGGLKKSATWPYLEEESNSVYVFDVEENTATVTDIVTDYHPTPVTVGMEVYLFGGEPVDSDGIRAANTISRFTPGSTYLEASKGIWLINLKDFLSGLGIGLACDPRNNTAKTPTAYLYNGVKLPALPEWDREKYPYALISFDDYSLDPSETFIVAFARLVKTIDYSNSTLCECVNYYAGDPHCTCTVAYGEPFSWGHYSSGEYKEGFGSSENDGDIRFDAIDWANFDLICQTDIYANAGKPIGSVYLKASEPIPVYE
jgi:N-acetylneuraminic acid mutarotase